MDRDEAFKRLTAIVVDTLGVDESRISESTTFADLDADSLDRLQLVMALEDEFGVTLPDEALGTIESMNDALDAVTQLSEA